MSPDEEKIFDRKFDEMLAVCSPEVKVIYGSKRDEIKKLVDTVQRGNTETDHMLRARLGPLYPFVVPQEMVFIPLRPTDNTLPVDKHEQAKPVKSCWSMLLNAENQKNTK